MKLSDLIAKIKKMFSARRVLVHTRTGDIILRVYKGDIIRVPWFGSYCPYHLEPDGTVTLLLMWDKYTPSAGYGKIWKSITWEEIKEVNV